MRKFLGVIAAAGTLALMAPAVAQDVVLPQGEALATTELAEVSGGLIPFIPPATGLPIGGLFDNLIIEPIEGFFDYLVFDFDIVDTELVGIGGLVGLNDPLDLSWTPFDLQLVDVDLINWGGLLGVIGDALGLFL